MLLLLTQIPSQFNIGYLSYYISFKNKQTGQMIGISMPEIGQMCSDLLLVQNKIEQTFI